MQRGGTGEHAVANRGGLPWIWTVASVGLTVPRTVTLLAAITLPLVGAVTTTTETAPEPTVLVVVEVVEPQPATAKPSTAMIPTVQDLITIGIVPAPARRKPYQEFGCFDTVGHGKFAKRPGTAMSALLGRAHSSHRWRL